MPVGDFVSLRFALGGRRAEQNARLAISNARDPTNNAEHGVERPEAVANDLGNQVPSAISSVKSSDFRNPTQSTDHLVGASTLNRDEHDGADKIRVAHVANPHRESDDDAAGNEPVDTTVHGSAGHTEALGEVYDRLASIRPQQGDEPTV